MVSGTRHAQRHRVTRLLGPAALLLTLAGVVAMHALGVHGATTGHDAMPGMVRAAMPSHDDHGPAVERGTAGERWTAVERGAAHAATSAAGMCVAVLAGLGWSLLRSRRTTVAVAGPALRKVARTARPGRDRDPPCLTALSVHRC